MCVLIESPISHAFARFHTDHRSASSLYIVLGENTHTSARRELILSAVFLAFFVGAIVVLIDCEMAWWLVGRWSKGALRT